VSQSPKEAVEALGGGIAHEPQKCNAMASLQSSVDDAQDARSWYPDVDSHLIVFELLQDLLHTASIVRSSRDDVGSDEGGIFTRSTSGLEALAPGPKGEDHVDHSS
jgi:hypothetical protein